jgi:hypothetical protein
VTMRRDLLSQDQEEALRDDVSPAPVQPAPDGEQVAVPPFDPRLQLPGEYDTGRIIRDAVEYDKTTGRFYLTCSVGELAQRLVVVLPLLAAPKQDASDTARMDWLIRRSAVVGWRFPVVMDLRAYIDQQIATESVAYAAKRDALATEGGSDA